MARRKQHQGRAAAPPLLMRSVPPPVRPSSSTLLSSSIVVASLLLAAETARFGIPRVSAATAPPPRPVGGEAGTAAERLRSVPRAGSSGRQADAVSAAAAADDGDGVIERIASTIRSWQEGRLLALAAAQHDQGGHGGGDGDGGPPLPFVTLTYAQSLDGFIAVAEDTDDDDDDADDGPDAVDGSLGRVRRRRTSSNLPLSCPSSMRMAHALRTVHDAVLVGGSTLSADNPRLNARLWPPSAVGNNDGEHGDGGAEAGGTGGAAGVIQTRRQHQPRPVVLDTDLRHLRELIEAGRDVRARGLVVCCAEDAAAAGGGDIEGGAAEGGAAEGGGGGGGALSSATASDVEILPCRRDPSSVGLDLRDVLERLRDRYGVQSVMVEGGAAVLSSFAAAGGLVDCLCVAVTPTLIGGGRGVCAFGRYDAAASALGGDDAAGLLRFGVEGTTFVTGVGSDCVFLAPWPR